MEQTNIFAYMMPNYEIKKKIRKIALFSGPDFQEMALRDLNLDFENYRTCEWDVNAFASAKAIHKANDKNDYSKDLGKEEIIDLLYELGISNDGKVPMKLESIRRKNEKWLRETYNNIKATNNLVNITNVHGEDLGIVDKDKYCYFVTYSFPCQDLSKAGKQLGMQKDSGTRSSMLWEVERILEELQKEDKLPDVLQMENVPDVVGTKNIQQFNRWFAKLESMGYQSYYKTINAKDFGIPQNRSRTFMISILGDYNYEWPKEIPLELRLKDMLEKEVDEKYYLSQSQIEYFEKHTKECEEKGLGFRFKPTEGDGISRTCTTHPSGLRMDDNFVKVIGNTNPSGRGINGNVSSGGLAPTLTTNKGEGPKIIVEGSLQGGKWDKVHEICRRVYSIEGISNSITAMGGGNQEPKIIEPLICASRERNSINPKSRKSGLETVQMIEINDSGCSNTLTTVQKDNYVIESGIKITEATKQGYARALEGDSVNLEQPNSKTRRGRVGKGIAQTLTTSCNQGVVENMRFYKQAIDTFNKNECDEGDTINAYNNTLDKTGVCPTITTRLEGFKTAILPVVKNEESGTYLNDSKDFHNEPLEGLSRTLKANNHDAGIVQNDYRIRKLTPLECWRLMGAMDDDFYKAAKVNSNSQLYKQAGNGIVKHVLMAIYKQMIPDDYEFIKK